MHLTDAQSERFYRVYYSLLEYANETFDILGEFFEPFDEVTGPEQIMDLSLFIFGGGDVDGGAEPDPAITERIIDSYIAANPLRLGEADLRQVAQWKSALADVFHVMEHTAASSAFMLDGECLFNVIGLTRDVSAAVRSTPAIVRTVLLPFDNAIVYGTTIRDFNVEIGPTMLGRLQGEYAELRAKGPKATSAEEFLREAPLCKQRAQAREEEDRAFLEEGLDTIDEPSQGMHRGVLAGMTPEEREAAVSAHYRQSPSLSDFKIQDELNDSYLYVLEPERTLLGTFLLMNKKELCDLARQEGMRGYSKLVKMELVAELWNHYEEMRYSLPHSFSACTPGFFDLAERTYRAGGMLEISRAEHDALPLSRRWLPWVPFLNVFDCDDRLYAVIPSEFMEKTSDEQWEDAIREHRELEHARHLTNTYLERCGLVEQGALTEVYRRYYPGELDAAGFEDFLWLNGPSSFERYNLWTYKGRTYVINAYLVDEDLQGDPTKQVHLDGDRPRRLGPEELLRRHLAERHERLRLWEVPGKTAADLEDYSHFAAIMAMSSALELREFLDANVPDGADDYSYAENIIENIEVAARLDIPPAEILDFVMEEGGDALGSGAKLSRLLALLTAFVNAVPRWSNNGWSPNDLLRREGELATANPGKRVFYDESGRRRKVGRNEPCPCGSGKKYKRCCGR